MEALSWYQVLGGPSVKAEEERPAAPYRFAICGPPSSGKTTIATLFGDDVRNTDALIEEGFHAAIEGVVGWLSDPSIEIIEGAIVPHALRKWMELNPEGKPVDRVVWLGKSHEELNDGQRAFAKGCRSVFDEITEPMRERGIRIIDRRPSADTGANEDGTE